MSVIERSRAERFDYRSNFGAEYHGNRRLPTEAEEWISTIRARKLQEFIKPTDRVLEYGVGFGWNLWKMKCGEKTGFDVTPELRSSVEAKGIRFESSVEQMERHRFDVIVCHHVLEHLKDPLGSLANMTKYLQPAGRILLFVPFEREREYQRYNFRDKAHHIYSWTPTSLTRMAQKAGLEVVSARLQKFRFDRFAAVVTRRMRGGLRMYRAIRGLGLLFLPEYEIALSARVKMESNQ